jgi:DUF4097 and DUF4098 domain-containing protein YvlB
VKRSVSLLLTLLFVLSACAPAPDQYTELETRAVDVMDAKPVLIQVDYGEVTILESQDSRVSVEGQVLFADELKYLVDSTEKQIKIQVFAQRDSSFKVPLHVVIHLPQQMQVKVETDDAAVVVQAYQGDVEIASTSGDITLEQVTGEMALRSNRGNITVQESSGAVGVVGNYGGLTVQNVHGDISASTIMGNVVFDGLIETGDAVRLETDHGAVSVHLSADSALTLQVNSTSGDVTCLLPEVVSSTRTCDGEIRSGGGVLAIRTVSGAVTVQLLP